MQYKRINKMKAKKYTARCIKRKKLVIIKINKNEEEKESGETEKKKDKQS